MTVVIFFLSLGRHGPYWTNWISRTKRIKGERISELPELSSLHSWLKVIPFLPWVVVTVLRERMGSSDLCVGTGLLNTTSLWCSALGVSQWRIPEAFSLCACSYEGCVMDTLGAVWHLTLRLCQASAVGLNHQQTAMSQTWASLHHGWTSLWTVFFFRGWWETLENMDWKVIRWSEYSLIALCFNFACETPS